LSKIIKPHQRDEVSKVKKFEKKNLAIVLPSQDSDLSPASPEQDSPPVSERLDQANPPDDAEKKGRQPIPKAHAEHAYLLAQEQGYQEGLARGREEALKALEEAKQASAEVLDSLVAQLKSQEADMMRLLVPRLADLATELARRIIHREISTDRTLVRVQAQEAIGKILEREKLIIRVNPADEDIMKSHKQPLMSMFDGIEKIEVIGDQSIERGGCIIETHLVKVDAQPRSQLQAARKTLLADAE